MKRPWTGLILAAVVTAAPASATVIDGPNVGALTTFVDQGSGRLWLDLDNFFGLSYDQLAAQASAAGFQVASRADVHGLLDSLPLSGGQWPAYSDIMGSAPNRGLIWGAYLPVSQGIVAWGYSFQGDLQWSYEDNTSFAASTVINDGNAYADMNVWAYREPDAVPEPGTLLLLGTGLAGFAARRRQRP